ncbi:MAG TPA: SIMPL domain-containing protein [Pseudonocardiaceae bacterium]|nr:SIMPL domain-containing protein [Pseudonocardiaceae bacterium]
MTPGRSIVAVLALGALTLSGCSSHAEPVAAGAGPASPPGITTRGLGTVTMTPDTVTVVLGVQTRGSSAKDALDVNTAKAAALINVLKARGVAAADLQTSQLSVNPVTEPTTGRITGYEVTNQVTAKLRDIGAAGGLIDAAGEAAGDAVRVQQLSFSVGDDGAARAQARADAMRQAQAHARQLADAAGVRLGPARSITEVAANPPIGTTGDRAQVNAPVPIEPGTQQLTVTVEAVYAIDQ